MMKTARLIFTFTLFLFLSYSCGVPEKDHQIKYCFLFIGDGMGVAQVNLTEAYLAAIDNEKGFHQLSFTQFPHAGLMKTFADNRFITCSAASATAFATGNKTNIGHISTDTTGKFPFKSIATICKEQGMKVGILSSVSIDHATPAVFYANQPSRSNYFEIGIELANSNFDFFGGGGFKTANGIMDSVKVNAIELAKKNGFVYVDSGLSGLKAGDGKVIAVYPNLLKGSAAMPYAIDKPESPTLADFTAKAIELLINESGFFMMVEGGKIDWACHSKDAASSIHETIAFDDAIQVALKFYRQHPDETLIVVTADHETGGMALGAEKTSYESYFQLLQYQKVSYDMFNSIVADFQKMKTGKKKKDRKLLLDLVAENFGLGTEIQITEAEEEKILNAFKKSVKKSKNNKRTYGDFSAFTGTLIRMMSEKSGVGWTTFGHTGINVPIYAIGPGAEKFSGVIDNTEIPEIMMQLLGIEQTEYTLVKE